MKLPLSLVLTALICILFIDGEAVSQTIRKPKKGEKRSEIVITQSPLKKGKSVRELYRQGYKLILDERWADARDRLHGVIEDFPESNLKEAAEYWIAFTLKEEGNTGAVKAYKTFIDMYAHSNYYDDAIADLNELLHQLPEPVKVSVPTIRMDGLGNITVDSLTVTRKHKNKGFSFYLPRVQTLEKMIQLKVHVKEFDLRNDLDRIIPPDMQKIINVMAQRNVMKLDYETFRILKNVALDRSSPEKFREAAIVSISMCDTFDALPVFSDIMMFDTNKGLQFYAIENLRQYTKDRNRAVSAMIKLFNELPEDREEEREIIFYSIADVGNDQAIDFLEDIIESRAKSRYVNEAIYYLGSIGTEKSRNTLRKVYKVR